MSATIPLPSDVATSDFPELGAEEPTGLVSAVREGIPAGRFDALKELLGVSTEQLTDVVGISPSTLSRRRKRGRFDKDESERILRVARIALRAAEVLGGPENARKWLTEPARALGGEKPLEFADTEPGAREVERLLIRLEHGVYS
jgi:putative toxin-antitoxin system antitoxin component (TIGR02293 family)